MSSAPSRTETYTMKPEELVLVTPPHQRLPGPQTSLKEVAAMGLLMLRPSNVIRRLVDEAFLRAECQPQVVAEIESIPTLVNAVTSGIGATILPLSAARLVGQACGATLTRLSDPITRVPLAMCASDRLAPSAAAIAVKSILTDLAEDLAPTIGALQSVEATQLFSES